ncbi:MAG TPA: carboxypeptidase-like regulatory domain-containing protein, partial [Candidatus Angelobacter sp.]|nr:carboxypeptidase-like regulatory domain-containing protein [Candidatus Angelobacter sp.]
MFTSKLRRRVVGAALCALVCVFSLAIHAQQLATASISGTVTDPAGNAVPGVTVALTNSSQGTVRTFTTQQDGAFSFTTLEAATYTLSVTASSGFAAWQQPITLNVGQDRSVSARLQIAGGKTQVQVRGDAQQGVNTTTSVVGGVINARQIQTLPLNGRNYLELALLVPGNAPAPTFDPTKGNTFLVS